MKKTQLDSVCRSGIQIRWEFKGGVQWHLMKSKDFVSKISSNLKCENRNLIIFLGQSLFFRLSIKDVYFFQMPITLIKSHYQTQLKSESQNQKPGKQNKISSLPSNLHLFKRKLKSVLGFFIFENFSKSWVVSTTIIECRSCPTNSWYNNSYCIFKKRFR